MIQTKQNRLFVITLTITYIAVIFLGLWFHIHPDEDGHHDGHTYHSHVEPIASHAMINKAGTIHHMYWNYRWVHFILHQ
ncbi:MAG: hypothetical protein ACE5I1_03740 [bacterium]